MKSSTSHPADLYDAEPEWAPLSQAQRTFFPLHEIGDLSSLSREAAVLGLLALICLSMLAPSMMRARAGANLASCSQNLDNLDRALRMYYSDYHAFPGSLSALTPRYLRRLPTCPAAERVTYRLHLEPDTPLTRPETQPCFSVHCEGGHHEDVNVQGDYPAYSSKLGLVTRAP